MKTSILAIAVATSLFAAKGEADVATPAKPPKPARYSRRLFIGPDVLYSHATFHNTGKGISVKATTNAVLYGFRAGYEYARPYRAYRGLEGGYTWGTNHTKVNYTVEHDPNMSFPQYHGDGPIRLGNIEGRSGFAFGKRGYFLLIPFVGVGGYHLSYQQNTLAQQTNWAYAAGGLRTQFTCTSGFNIGLNLKAMRTLYIHTHVQLPAKEYKARLNNNWGYEVELPMTWRLTKHWDLQFKPYFAKLDIDSSEDLWGGRLLLGCNF